MQDIIKFFSDQNISFDFNLLSSGRITTTIYEKNKFPVCNNFSNYEEMVEAINLQIEANLN